MTKIHGLDIIQSAAAIDYVQFRFPRSKKKRIRIKWSKRPDNHRETPTAIQLGNTIMVHPEIHQRLMGDLVNKFKLAPDTRSEILSIINNSTPPPPPSRDDKISHQN
jgi:hypothetical protein